MWTATGIYRILFTLLYRQQNVWSTCNTVKEMNCSIHANNSKQQIPTLQKLRCCSLQKLQSMVNVITVLLKQTSNNTSFHYVIVFCYLVRQTAGLIHSEIGFSVCPLLLLLVLLLLLLSECNGHFYQINMGKPVLPLALLLFHLLQKKTSGD